MEKTEVTRYVSVPAQKMLWGISAGRCEFDGCNKPLWKSSVTQDQVNIAEKAHIWSFSDTGPRGHSGIDKKAINDISNLMLVCHDCHRLVDQDNVGDQYSVALLLNMKRRHEERIELAASIAPERSSYILLYGANIGEHASPISYNSAAEAMFPERYPAESKPLTLGLARSAVTDDEELYFEHEKKQLEKQFSKVLKPRLVENDINHLSVFALAPQPLLMLLGKLLSDIPAAEIYQRHREPPTWRWQLDGKPNQFQITAPKEMYSTVALILSLSATITHDRIHKVLGDDVAIWEMACEMPHNDFLKTRGVLSELRGLFRQLLDQIKAKHGHESVLHVFPAMPVSAAVELGRVLMPKADMTLRIYDEVKKRNGFIHAFDL